MICFIDFETTGIDVFRDEPIEIGAILVNDKLEIICEYSSRISLRKSVYLTKRAFKIHNISVEDLKDSPSQKEVLDNFFSLFGTEYKLGGWNISFDVSFLRKLCNKNGRMIKYNKINHRHIDVQSLCFLANSLELVPVNNNSLSDWIEYFNLKRSDYHSAMEDAKLTFEVYKKLLILFQERLY